MCRRHVSLAALAVLAATALAAPGFAHPPAPVDEQGRPIRGQLHTWMHQAKVPLVRGRVVIKRSYCPTRPSLAGCLLTARPRIIYLSPRAFEPRLVLYHELGHTFDLLVLNPRERRQFKRIVGIRRHGWFRGALPPSEWFADGYAACAVRPRVRRAPRRTLYGYSPSRGQHARVCALIRSAVKPRGRRPQQPRNPPRVIEVEPPPPQQTQPGQGGACTLFDQLTTGCKPAPAPAPGPPQEPPGPPPLPLPAG